VFESIGEQSEVTVFYAGAGKGGRQWSSEHIAKNYNEKSILTFELGPLVIAPFFWYQLLVGKFDIMIPTTTSRLLSCSLIMIAVSYITRAEIFVWTEHVQTEWESRTESSILMKGAQLLWEAFQTEARNTIYANSDRIVALSDLAAEAARQQAPQSVPIVASPQAFPSSKLPNNRVPLTESNKFRIIYIGQLIERKGVDVLINAVKEINSPYELIIAGDGDKKEELERQISGKERISIIGYINETEKAILYETADLLVLPTRRDPWGLVVNEALHFEIPVITTEAAGSKMILGEDNVVPTDDPQKLRQKVKDEIDTPSDPPSPPQIEDMARHFYPSIPQSDVNRITNDNQK
jgi:glycosyltransferase involved in cell wall biosynthesis